MGRNAGKQILGEIDALQIFFDARAGETWCRFCRERRAMTHVVDATHALTPHQHIAGDEQ
ncbi:hypothetical protein M770_33140 (plasmid) [Pseudomonas aeruginosa VRFPA03]|nr:hypothetical protein M770_33140 [Pseudomonas aeruginosa VRFPA03]